MSTASWREWTPWVRRSAVPLRAFIQTEAGSAGVLVAAVVAALVWANVAPGSYAQVWDTRVALGVGRWGTSHALREWVDSGLMTLFFLVVGLEARREFDLGDLRERRRFVLPLAAGLVGMAVPVALFLAVTAGTSSAHGWGVAMSTDTALALGLLAILGRDIPDKVRTFVLTVFVVDDLVALLVIAVFYSSHVELVPLLVALAAFAALLLVVRLQVGSRLLFAALAVVVWATLWASGIDPVVAGLAIGLSASAYTPNRDELEQATALVREFREQPTAELARVARGGVSSALSPNARLQVAYHRWTSYLIVPVFALANAGITLHPSFLADAYTSRITLAVVLGYVVGKPLAVVATSAVVTAVSRGRIRPPVGWASVLGSGTIAGIGFTVALLIATRAYSGQALAQAKLGALTAAFLASLVTWLVFRVVAALPARVRDVALVGDPRLIQDLVPAVDPVRDHVRGSSTARITVIEFGDFQCPYCGQAEPVVRALLADTDVRYVWRHLPLPDVHPQAQIAAEAAEAAAEQGAFWAMHDLLLEHQDELQPKDLLRHAATLGLDVERFRVALADHRHATRVAQDVESADLSGAAGTPSFYINGQRHHGAYDVATLTAAIRAVQAQLRATAA